MSNYEKANKVRKECENRKNCIGEYNCPYYDKCYKSNILISSPGSYDIKRIARAIKVENWNVE